jgi:hypothetical protein
MDVAPFMPLDALALLPPPEAPEQNVAEPPTPVDGAVTGDAVPAGDEPRPTVPSPVAPRPLAPTLAMMPGIPTVEFPDITELPELEGGARKTALPLVDVAVGELSELVTPELLTELHGVMTLVPAPSAPGSAEGRQFVEGLILPPSKVGSPIAP